MNKYRNLKVMLISNMMSHHQVPICMGFVDIIGEENFKFAVTSDVDPERINMGWSDNESYSWVLNINKSSDDRFTYEHWWDIADIVICGERFFDKIINRVKNDKIALYMSERWWKPSIGIARMLSPRILKSVLRMSEAAKYNNFYYLAIGPFAALDMIRVGINPDKILLWGYFTELHQYVIKNTSNINVLWVGRMISWKRVDLVVLAFNDVVKYNKFARLTLVGDGPEIDNLKKLVKDFKIEKNVVFVGSKPAHTIKNFMRDNNFFIFPSNAYEGWGAVVNEAMSSGCIVIADKSIGAAATLIKDGENGFLVDAVDYKYIANKICEIFENNQLMIDIGVNASDEIKNNWSPRVAAEKIIELYDVLKLNAGDKYKSTGILKKFSH